MKKIFLIICLSMFIYSDAIAYNSLPADIKSKLELIEKETNTYSGEKLSPEERVKNAEVYVFGASKHGDINNRINNLSAVLGLPVDNKHEETIYEIENDTKANYPAVDKMEKQIFGTTYEKENIYKRLERLEKKLIGKISDNSLNERVLNLQEKVKPPKTAEKESISQKNADNHYDYGEYNYYSSKAENPEISIMEKKLLGKNYENEDMEKRLSRLENKLFGKTFESQSENTRIERLKSVYKAAKSGTEYKVNKFAKYAIAGAQIGGILLLILAMIL